MDCFKVQIAISQQPILRSYPHFKLRLRYQSKVFKYFKWRRPPKEDDLKILKVEYFSNYLLDQTQTLNLSLYDQTIFYNSFKWRRPPMEDDLQSKITSNGRRPSTEDDLEWKSTSNGRQPPMEDDLQWKTTSNGRWPLMEEDLQWKMTFNVRRPPMENDLKILKVEYLSNHCIKTYEFSGRN
jgi:hypothetical protein